MDKKSLPKIYGILGYPAKHSLSPLMHNAAFQALKINAEYRIFEVRPEGLEDFLLKTAFRENISGFNITIPYKVKAREILEKKFPFNKDSYQMLENLYYVKLSGAVNTVKRENGELKYFNTDATGFFKSLEHDLQFTTKNKNVLLVGCGGAGRAVIASLSWRQHRINKIFINDINEDAISSARNHFSKFPHLNDKLEFISAEDISGVISDCQLLINATPIGMKEGDASIVDKKFLHKDLYVYDLVYNREAQLVKDAKSIGLRVVDGLGMLLYQGADAFELWTAKEAPIKIMRKALMKASSHTIYSATQN